MMRPGLPEMLVVVVALGAGAGSAFAMPDAFAGETMVTAANFCPAGWLPMNGQIVTVADYPALHDALGAAYGGNGRTTFGVPMAPPVYTADHRPLLSCISTITVTPPT